MTSVAAPKRQNPNEFLKQIIGRPVVVKLNSGVTSREGNGKLIGVWKGTERVAVGKNNKTRVEK